MVKNMGSLVWLLLAFLYSSVLFSSSLAYNFYVGGRDGWVSNPVETYNHWAETNRFQVNDTLTFKMKQGSEESVLVVKKDDYYSCNTKNPIMNLQSSNFVFKLDHSGPFFFISADKQNCLKGQRLIVVVMAVRHQTPSPKSSPVSPSPESSSPVSPSPESSSPVTPSPKSPSPSSSGSLSPAASSPKSSSPSLSPSPVANSPKSPSLSPSPVASSPKSPSLSPSPAANSPKPSSPSPHWSMSPSPVASSPSLSPSPGAEGPMSPAISPSAESRGPAPAPTPESGETADFNSPAPANSKSGSQSVTASTSMMLIMAIGVVILSVGYGV